MARPKLTLYLDIVSPFAYMAFYITRVCQRLDWCGRTDFLDSKPLSCPWRRPQPAIYSCSSSHRDDL